MAYLSNQSRTLRWKLQLADKEILPPAGQKDPPPSGTGRILATTSLDFFDRRDKDYWPLYRQPVLWISIEDGRNLVDQVSSLIRGEVASFAFQPAGAPEIGWGFARGEDGGYTVELGFDLHAMLAHVSGAPGESGRDLALFRFATTQAELVAFADQLRTELRELLPQGFEAERT